MARALLFNGHSRYGAVRAFTFGLARALRGLGHEADIVELGAPSFAADLNAAFARPVDFGFGFCGWGLTLAADGGNIWDRLGIPFVCHLIDYPSGWIEAINQVRHAVVAVADRSYLDYLAAFCAQPAFFMPLASDATAPTADVRSIIPRLVFAGTPLDPDAPLRNFAERERDILVAWAAALARDGNVFRTGQALAENLGIARTDRLRFFAGAQAAIDRMRALRRRELLTAMVRLDVPLTLIGDGWDHLLPPGNVQYQGDVPFDELGAHFAHFAAVLIAAPQFADGLQERIPMALQAGSLPIADSNPYVAEALGNMVLRYDWDRLDSLAALARTATAGPSTPEDREFRRVAGRDHCWLKRARTLLDHVATIAAR